MTQCRFENTRPPRPVCRCGAYPFPHRQYGGKCYYKQMEVQEYYKPDDCDVFHEKTDDMSESDYNDYTGRN